MVYLALSYGHGLVDGADAIRFVVAVKERLAAGNFEAELALRPFVVLEFGAKAPGR